MGTCDFDVITVGGGLGGAALAKVLAENGLRVLVVEREREFKDRIRGEFMAPWGVAEIQKLGLYERLIETCAHQVPNWNVLGSPFRDLLTTTPQKLPSLCFYHPEMQEVILDSAGRAGAQVRRGATVRQVKPGQPAVATVEGDGTVREHTARMVVCADGRSSTGRTWGGFVPQRGKQRLFGTGLLFDDMSVPDDTSLLAANPFVRQMALLFPQGNGRVRGYVTYDPDAPRLKGLDDTPRFIERCVQTGLPAEYYAGARPVAPLATFDMTEHWVWHPYSDGLALIGDAAGATDPTWGQGLSTTARDVRLLSERLLASDDWDAAGHDYARARDEYFKTKLTVEDWFFELFFGQGVEADQRRMRALPLMAQEPDRSPDHFLSGPDLPCDENVRRRFFAED